MSSTGITGISKDLMKASVPPVEYRIIPNSFIFRMIGSSPSLLNTETKAD